MANLIDLEQKANDAKRLLSDASFIRTIDEMEKNYVELWKQEKSDFNKREFYHCMISAIDEIKDTLKRQITNHTIAAKNTK